MNRGPGPSRHSARIDASESTRVLDDATRARRLKRQLAALEQDNAQEDPHANLVWHKDVPKFDDDLVTVQGQKGKRKAADGSEPPKKRKRFRMEYSKQRFRKNFAALLDEERNANKDDEKIKNAYDNATAPHSRVPPRHFCTACGCISKYTCIKCGARYCTIRCRDVHNDTRCLKWTS